MKRGNSARAKSLMKSIQAHVMFVVILMLGAFFRIASEDQIDRNTIIFAALLAFGIIIVLSFFNQFVIDLFNDLNSKRKAINCLMPGILLGLLILILRIPIDIFDVILLIILFSIANLALYSTMKESQGTHGR